MKSTKANIEENSIELSKCSNVYQDSDFLTQMKAQFVCRVCTTFAIIVVFFIITSLYIQYAYYGRIDIFTVATEFIALLSIFTAGFMISRGQLNTGIRILLLLSFSAIWLIMFFDSNNGLARFDSIAISFGVLTMTPLISNKNKYTIAIYTLLNIIMLAWFCVYAYSIQIVATADIIDYFVDNAITYVIIATISYNIHSIYKKAIDRSDAALKQANTAEEDLKILNEHLEEKVLQRTNELNEALATIEEANYELNELNETIAQEAGRLQILNEKLSDSEQQLKLANQTKDKFFSIIAHDLRNPFVPIINSSDILLNYQDKINPEEQQKLITMINSSSRNVYALLENLLQWARTQNGSMEFYPEEENIYTSFQKIIKIIYPQAEQKGIEFIFNMNNSIVINYDINMINTVIRNLLTNAIKFTTKGGKIEIGSLTSNELSGHRSFYVKDSGIGMDETTIENIFKLDVKTSRSGTSGEAGTGLGLILCKEFIEKHDGKIWVESEVGKGSTFYFTLPTRNK